jgi:hypothetical protein
MNSPEETWAALMEGRDAITDRRKPTTSTRSSGWHWN